MTERFALAGYLRRIGFEAEPRADEATLRALHALHPAAIAFENLDTLAGRRVSLEIDDVHAKLVDGCRGGYCFEHNTLLAAALEAVGFEVGRLAARVVWNREAEPALPRTHMLLRVATPAGERLCDVGFGGVTLTAPLEFRPDIEQRADDAVYRLVEAGAEYELQVRVGGRFRPMYRFDFQPQLPVDIEMMNHFVGTHAQSHFRTRLIAGLFTADGRLGLANNRFTCYRPDGTREERILGTVPELHDALVDELGIAVELDDALEQALGRCIA